jgi:hypothetical protein
MGKGISRPTRIRTLTDRTKICSATVTPWVCICGCKYKLKGEYSSTIGIDFLGKLFFLKTSLGLFSQLIKPFQISAQALIV